VRSGSNPIHNGPGTLGQYNDVIGLGGGGGFAALQTFTVTVASIYGIPGFSSIPVFVETLDGKEYGTNVINVFPNGVVDVNGDNGLNSDGSLHKCRTNRY